MHIIIFFLFQKELDPFYIVRINNIESTVECQCLLLKKKKSIFLT